MRNTHKIVVGKPEGKKPFVRSRHRWEENTEMNLGKPGLQAMEWADLAQYVDQ
jgi:hypothetical protein